MLKVDFEFVFLFVYWVISREFDKERVECYNCVYFCIFYRKFGWKSLVWGSSWKIYVVGN